MAKTPKVKKREVSIHSRAARRASPSAADVAAKGPVEESDYKPWMHSAQGGGIQKKQKKKQLTRQQKVRQEKALEKAEQNAAKLETKTADSKSRARKVQARRAEWEDLNEKLVALQESKAKEAEVKKPTRDPAAEKPSDHGDEVVMPDLEQPLAIRSAEMSGAEEETGPAKTVVGTQPAWASKHAQGEDFVDEIT